MAQIALHDIELPQMEEAQKLVHRAFEDKQGLVLLFAMIQHIEGHSGESTAREVVEDCIKFAQDIKPFVVPPLPWNNPKVRTQEDVDKYS